MVEAYRQARIRRYEGQAEGYLELGMPEHALRALAQLDRAAEFTTHTLYLEGEALRGMERYHEALVPLSQAALGAPHQVHVWLALGWCRKRTGRVDLAVEALERAVELSPSDALNHYNLACYLSLTQEKDRALAHLSRALKIDPKYRTMIDDEPDFDPLRNDPGFLALTSMIV